MGKYKKRPIMVEAEPIWRDDELSWYVVENEKRYEVSHKSFIQQFGEADCQSLMEMERIKKQLGKLDKKEV